MLTCGDFDGNLLRRETQHKEIHDKVPNYFKRTINVKKVWPRGKKPNNQDFRKVDTIYKAQMHSRGESEMLKQLGLDFIGRPHSGIDDATNLARCVIELLKGGFEFTQGMVKAQEY